MTIDTDRPDAPPATQPFSEVLDQAINASDRTLESIQRRLLERGFEVSVASLSYWRSGRSLPSRASSLRCIPHLEQILGVPAGQLSRRLPSTAARSRKAKEAELPADAREVLAEVMEELGLALEQELVDVSVHMVAEVDAEGSIRSYRIRNTVRAAHDGAQRMPAIVTDSDRTGAPQLVTSPGCHIGKVVRRPEAGVYVAEIVLDRPLVRDGLAVMEHGEDFRPRAFTDAYLSYAPLRRVKEVALTIRFDPSRLPTEVVAHHETTDGELAVQTELIGPTAQLVLHDFGPSSMGLRWTW